MPAWTTPELWLVWCAPMRGSRSSTTIRRSGWRAPSSAATASPTMPAPTTARSQLPSTRCSGALGGADLVARGGRRVARRVEEHRGHDRRRLAAVAGADPLGRVALDLGDPVQQRGDRLRELREPLLVDDHGPAREIGLGPGEPALLRGGPHELDELVEVGAGHRLLDHVGHAAPRLRRDPRARHRAVVVLHRPAHLLLALELDEAEVTQDADVVA